MTWRGELCNTNKKLQNQYLRTCPTFVLQWDDVVTNTFPLTKRRKHELVLMHESVRPPPHFPKQQNYDIHKLLDCRNQPRDTSRHVPQTSCCATPSRGFADTTSRASQSFYVLSGLSRGILAEVSYVNTSPSLATKVGVNLRRNRPTSNCWFVVPITDNIHDNDDLPRLQMPRGKHPPSPGPLSQWPTARTSYVDTHETCENR